MAGVCPGRAAVILERPAAFSSLIRKLRAAPDEALKSHRSLLRDQDRLMRRLDEKSQRLRRSEDERQQAEAELRIFRQAVDSGPAAIAMADRGGVVRYVNQAFSDWEFRSGGDRGPRSSELWDQSGPENHFAEILEQGRRPGASRPSPARAVPGSGHGSRFLTWTGGWRAHRHLRGVTARAAWNAAQAQHRMAASLVENMNDVSSRGTDGIPTYLSPSWRGMGLEAEELRGPHFAPTCTRDWTASTSSCASRVRPALVDDFRLRRKDGGLRLGRVSVRRTGRQGPGPEPPGRTWT